MSVKRSPRISIVQSQSQRDIRKKRWGCVFQQAAREPASRLLPREIVSIVSGLIGGIFPNREFSMTNSQLNFARTGASALGGEFTSSYGASGAERPVIENGALSAKLTASDRVNILGVGAMPLDLGKAVAMLEQWRVERRREYVCLISVHGLVVAQREPTVRSALNRCGLAAEDGMPLVWWSQPRRLLAGAPRVRLRPPRRGVRLRCAAQVPPLLLRR